MGINSEPIPMNNHTENPFSAFQITADKKVVDATSIADHAGLADQAKRSGITSIMKTGGRTAAVLGGVFNPAVGLGIGASSAAFAGARETKAAVANAERELAFIDRSKPS